MRTRPEPDPREESDQERVRQLLGDVAREEELAPAPVPEDVARRLDRSLAELGAQRDPDEAIGAAGTDRADEVAARRHRRRRPVPRLVAAAAVALLLGTGGLATLALSGGPGPGAGSDQDGAASGPLPERSAASAPQPAEEPLASAQVAPESAPTRSGGAGSGARQGQVAPPALTRAALATETGTLLATGALEQGSRAGQEREVAQQGCAVPSRAGTLAVVTLDGEPAVLVLSARDPEPATPEELDGTRDGEVGGTQRGAAVVLDCAGTTTLARTELTLPD